MAKVRKLKKKDPPEKNPARKSPDDYISPEKVVGSYDGTVLELADALPLITKVAKLLGKGRTEAYVKKRFGITGKTLRSWVSTTTFLRNYSQARAKSEAARQRALAQEKGKFGHLIIDGSSEAPHVAAADDFTRGLDSLIRLPSIINNKKRDKYERYTPEEQDAIMMMLALDGNIARVAKRVGMSVRTLEGWKRRMSVSDRDNFMRMCLLRRANFIDSVAEHIEGITVAYCSQLIKQNVVNTADAKAAASVVKDMLSKLDDLYKTYSAAIPEATKGMSSEEQLTVGEVVEGAAFRRLAKLLGGDKEGAKEIRNAIAGRISREKNIINLGASDAE